MKHLKYLIFVSLLFLTPNVFAKDINVTSNCYGSTGYSNMYDGHEVQYQTDSVYNFGTRYEKQLSSFETQLRYNLSANTDYVITFNTNNSDDFRNNFKTYNVYDNDHNDNNLIKSFTFVSMKKVKISFRTTSATSRVTIQMGGSNNYDSITGVNNWNIKSAILTVPDDIPSGSTNQDIINNQTNNTNNIINNNNENTSDIINNNNQNTETITNSIEQSSQAITNVLGNLCPNLFNKDTALLYKGIDSSNGNLYDNNSTFVSDFIKVESNTDYYINGGLSSAYGYDNSKNYLGVIINTVGNKSFNTGNAEYIRVKNWYSQDGVDLIQQLNTSMLVKGTISKSYCEFGSYSSKLDDTTNAINETNEYLKDDTDPNIQDNDFLSMFNSVGVNDPLSYLLTLPTQLINKLVSLSDTCSSINLGTLYGVMITLPCINLENILGSSVWNIIDVIFSVSLLVVILKNLYDTFSNLLTMGAEKEAKEKFSMPTPMDFLSMILGGDR